MGERRRRLPRLATEGGDDGGTLARPRARHCGASGWRLRVGCTDGVSTAVCPRCDQLVGTRLDILLGRPIHVIRDHVA